MGKLAYKVFDADWKCRGYNFKNEKGEVIGTIHKTHENPKLCKTGFHYCVKLTDCFNYYNFDSENKVALIEVLGDIDTEKDSEKECTNEFKILKQLTWHEVLEMCNTGSGNTGYRNTGNRNAGDKNTGNVNRGDWNTGSGNTGSGNTGDDNMGYRNTGDWNTGNRNTGFWNTGNRNTGFFNTTSPNEINVFNKSCKREEWEKVELPSFLYFNLTEWITLEKMTYEEKKQNKEAETLGGYLKKYEYKEAFKNSYLKAKKQKDFECEFKKLINLPNFDKEIFKEISGIDIDVD